MANLMQKYLLFLAMSSQGVHFERAFRTAVDNQTKRRDELDLYQQERLNTVFRVACAGNPAYQQLLEAHGTTGLKSEVDVSLSCLPAVSKDELAGIAAAVPGRQGLFPPILKRTSGSSGRPLSLLKQRSGLAMELGATWRCYGWYGIHPGDRYVRVWGRPFDWRKRFFNAAKSVVLNSVHISAFDVTDAELEQRLQQIRACKPRFLYGYASALRDLAKLAISQDLGPPESLCAVITTAEPLNEDTRLVIERAFSAPCRDEYGCSEVGSIAHECSFGQLHIVADNLVGEILQDDGSVSRTGFGELLITDLTNELTPVIRYRVGDYCEISEADNCMCGLPFPVVSNVLGRVEDTIVLPDGTRHHPAKICYLVDKVDEDFRSVQQYQVIQYQPSEFELRVVVEHGHQEAAYQACAQTVFSDELGEGVMVKVVLVPEIQREASGKFRIVVSRCSPR